MPGRDPLAAFHPLVQAWFAERFGEPTAVQREAWARIAAGEHVLATAPTGSGKTLAAFLWAIDRLLTGAWPAGAVRVLYVSPLKALGNDIRRNLEQPLVELGARFAAAGTPMPAIRALVRSGDTPAEERARMARRPPEILVTTPESLNIMLTSRRGRDLLAGVATVILDEVHAVVGGKRGVHLITAVERLSHLAGEVQRIALSATVRPLDAVARWVGGASLAMVGGEPVYRPRPVAVIAPPEAKVYDIEVRFPAAADPDAAPDRLWQAVVAEIRAALARNRSTLVFANSRRVVEKLTRLINEDADVELAWSHHGSLSREIRAVVEERLKAGELSAIVATSSLELGIDIGALDEVVLVQAPPTVAAAVQRIGRAGHAVGAASRGRFVPLHPADLLYAAVTARQVLAGEIEETAPRAGALDVLSQVIVSMTATETWPVDELYATIRCAEPYRNLRRAHFDLVLEMLAGRYASARIGELKPVVSIDRIDGTVRGRPGAERLVYLSGGTIPDRGYFHLRVDGTNALLGELDEEFVWERSIGDAFTLGVQAWRIERVTHNDVFVRPTRGAAAMAPFWRADERDRPHSLLAAVGDLLERAESRLAEPAFARELERDFRLHPTAAAALLRHLAAQKAATRVLPHRHRVVAERVQPPQQHGEPALLILHTLWGGTVNRPFAIALAAAWERRYRSPVEVMHDDACITVAAATIPPAAELLSLVSAAAAPELVRDALARTGFFGARFRHAAACALLLPREGFRRRTPLWLSRQRAKELLDAVRRFDDFPAVLEAWRTCLEDEFQLDALSLELEALEEGRTEVVEVTTDAPSPFAAGVSWRRTNALMYEDDTPASDAAGRVRPDLLKEVVGSAHLRPRLSPALVDAFRRKLQRIHPGWAPRDAAELLDAVKERVALTPGEWRELLAACERDWSLVAEALLAELPGKIAAVAFDGPSPRLVCAVEALPRIARACGLDPRAAALTSPRLNGAEDRAAHRSLAAVLAAEPTTARADAAEPDQGDPAADLVADLLRSHGPIERDRVAAALPLDPESLNAAIEELADAGRVVVDALIAGDEAEQVCLADTLERLLRLMRAQSRPAFTPLRLDRLPQFLAAWQGVGGAGSPGADLEAALERLFGWPAPAELWETEILPARLDPYYTAWLDALLAETGLTWVGCGDQRLAFVVSDDRELIAVPESEAEAGEGADTIVPTGPGRFTFEELAARAGAPSAALAKRLWRLAWRGEVANDSFAAVRQGIASAFNPRLDAVGGGLPAVSDSRLPAPDARLSALSQGVGHGRRAPRSRRAGFSRWRSQRPFAGHWYRVPPVTPPADAVEEEECSRDRVRLLLDRYGVLFRELLERELPPLQWGRVFRTLRIMELSGEVVSGQFFAGLPGIQFASHAALRRLEQGLAEDSVFWLNACDPASPCGLGVSGLVSLPHRLPGNHLAYRGAELVVVSERRGRRLTIAVGPDHPDLPRYLAFLKVALTRQERPVKGVVVETINDEPAADSPYRAPLAALFHVTRDGSSLRLGRKY
jgi:ATP-dependent Lhr-like helicase